MNLFCKTACFLPSFFILLIASAQDIERVNAGARKDLDGAIQRLANLRDVIAEEKVELSRGVNAVKEEAAVKRRELERLQRLKDNADLGLERLQAENQKLEEDLAYVSNLVKDYAREFDANIAIAERLQYKASLASLHEATHGEALNVEMFIAEFRFLQTALEHLEKVTGGHRYQSSMILGPKGTVESGSCLLIGPVSFFANDTHAGLIQSDQGPPLRPRIQPLEKEQVGQIHDFFLKGEGGLPFDPTLRDALRINASKRGFVEEIKAGGVWIWPILLFALISLIGAMVKLVEVFTIHNPSSGVLEKILIQVQQGNTHGALDLAAQVKGPFRPLLEHAIDFARSKKELLEEVLFEKILEAQPRLERFLPFIAVTAAASPLLGLLGTVTGMMGTFDQIREFYFVLQSINRPL